MDRTQTLIVLGTFGAILAYWLGVFRRYRETKTLRAALERASVAATEAQAAATKLGALATLHERRAGEFFGIIEGIEKERDTWQRFYRDSSHSAGVAQSWLAREIARVIGEANARSKKLRELGHQVPDLRPDPALEAVVAQFATTHGSDSLEAPRAPGLEAAKNVEKALPPGE